MCGKPLVNISCLITANYLDSVFALSSFFLPLASAWYFADKFFIVLPASCFIPTQYQYQGLAYHPLGPLYGQKIVNTGVSQTTGPEVSGTMSYQLLQRGPPHRNEFLQVFTVYTSVCRKLLTLFNVDPPTTVKLKAQNKCAGELWEWRVVGGASQLLEGSKSGFCPLGFCFSSCRSLCGSC